MLKSQKHFVVFDCSLVHKYFITTPTSDTFFFCKHDPFAPLNVVHFLSLVVSGPSMLLGSVRVLSLRGRCRHVSVGVLCLPPACLWLQTPVPVPHPKRFETGTVRKASAWADLSGKRARTGGAQRRWPPRRCSGASGSSTGGKLTLVLCRCVEGACFSPSWRPWLRKLVFCNRSLICTKAKVEGLLFMSTVTARLFLVFLTGGLALPLS